MRVFEPIGKDHRQMFITKDGHFIEKVWKRTGLNTFVFDAVYDKCQDMENARIRNMKYIMRGL